MLRFRPTFRRLLAGVAPIALAACESAAPKSPARVLKAPAFEVTDNEWLPFAFNVRGCTERVRVSGTFHVLGIFNLSAIENETDHFHVNVSATGTGLTTGWQYHFNDSVNLMQQFRDGVRHIESQIETLKLIGDGGIPDTKVRGRFQFVVNANGETTVDFDETETICQ